MKRVILAITILLMVVHISYAATVVNLKSGRKVEGSLVERTDQYVVINFNGVKLTFWLNEIEDIDGEKMFSGTAVEEEFSFEEEYLNVTSTVGMQPKETASSPMTVLDSQESFRESKEYRKGSSTSTSQTFEKAIQKRSGLDKIDSVEGLKMQRAGTAVAGGVFIFMFLFWLVLYAYFAFCLQRIAQKIGTENSWLAWIPIANMYLMCNMASKPVWWMVLMFVPIANIIIGILLWFEIIKALNKPGWLVVLMFVPIANFALFGYLAFSKGVDSDIPKTEKNA